MKILRLLSNFFFLIALTLFFGLTSYAEEQPVDIWNIDKKELENNTLESELIQKDKKIKSTSEVDIYNMQTQKKNYNRIR